ncbi:MAG: hypothetical protein ACRCWR_06140 [Saezia sp.]
MPANYILHTGKASICADGAPNAYHPAKGMGLDFIGNAGIFVGRRKSIWGVALDANRDPYIQKSGAYKGYYVSCTSLFDPDLKKDDIHRYVNASEVSYCIVPMAHKHLIGYGVAMRYGDKISYGITADCGPRWGELSIKAALDLGINPSPKNGGVRSGVDYIIFTQSSIRDLWINDKSGNLIVSKVREMLSNVGGIITIDKLKQSRP